MAAPGDEDLEDIIFGSRSTGDQPNLEILMEQYKLFVETSERLVTRHQVVNTFFLSVNALGKGEDSEIYKPFTATEEFVSEIFILIYALTALVTMVWLIAPCL